jgi:pSer/pThr/pTyr-binding forkhead associated (FHA) protein
MTGIVLLILRLCMLVALYIFLGWGIFTLWQDLQRNKQEVKDTKPSPISIFRKGGETNQEFPFDASEIFIGRDPACDIVLEDPTTSARHTHLYFLRGHWWVEDMNSTNGTCLNEEFITVPVVLADQDIIQCGQVQLSSHL